MGAENGKMPSWQHTFVAELSRDKKKTAILATLVVVAGVVGGRMLFRKSAPKATVAAVRPEAPAPAPAVALAVAPAPPAAEVHPQGDSRLQAHIEKLNKTIGRDLFVADIKYFPHVSRTVKADKPGRITPVRKSPKEVVEEQAGKLVLQSTIISATPIAIINGRMLHVNGVVGGFIVKEITSRNCVVEKEGVTVILRMKGQEQDTREKF